MVSHPTRVRGLKSRTLVGLDCPGSVAPHAGAWIEIVLGLLARRPIPSRTPRGCVD